MRLLHETIYNRANAPTHGVPIRYRFDRTLPGLPTTPAVTSVNDCEEPVTRHRGSPDAGVAKPNLTPLLDVVLQLITFFMMLVHFGSRLEGSTSLVRLPVAPAALPGSDLTVDRLAVVIDAEGRLRARGQALDEAASAGWWADQARSRRAGLEVLGERAPGVDDLPTVVILRADRSASYGAVRRALTAAQEQGFAHFSLVVLRTKP
jgi:biopolymer transport protein ExbD